MKNLKLNQLKLGKKQIVVIVGGLGLLLAGGAIAFWQTQPQNCVRFTSTGGQEIIYSRGCINPQRYKKWVITS